jgi:hypothetical protein
MQSLWNQGSKPLEGAYWLIRLVEDSVTLAATTVTESDQRFCRGTQIVRAKYFRHTNHICQSKGREYEFLKDGMKCIYLM